MRYALRYAIEFRRGGKWGKEGTSKAWHSKWRSQAFFCHGIKDQ
jgi:hypothetical protein